MLLAVKDKSNFIMSMGRVLIVPERLNQLAIEAFIRRQTKQEIITPDDYKEINPGELLVFYDPSNRKAYRQPLIESDDKVILSTIIQSEPLIYEKTIRNTYVLLKRYSQPKDNAKVILYPNQLLTKWKGA